MNIDNFLITLPIMLKGMLGIFVVTAVIVVCMRVLVCISDKADKS